MYQQRTKPKTSKTENLKIMKIVFVNEKEIQITGVKYANNSEGLLTDTTPGTIVTHGGKRIKIGRLVTSYRPDAGETIGATFSPEAVSVYRYRLLK